MKNHVMMDIETLSTDSNAVVVSISCVQFDLETGELGFEFEVGLKLNPQVKAGGHVDMDTIMWWMGQEDAAREALTSHYLKPVKDALAELNLWFGHLCATGGFDMKDLKIWGNGATFDNVIVRNLYKRHGMDMVVPYWGDNDVRTLVTMAGIDTRAYKFEGIKHHGLDDCKHQIKYCVDGLQKLKGSN